VRDLYTGTSRVTVINDCRERIAEYRALEARTKANPDGSECQRQLLRTLPPLIKDYEKLIEQVSPKITDRIEDLV
jgi:hypothetical protein